MFEEMETFHDGGDILNGGLSQMNKGIVQGKLYLEGIKPEKYW